MPDYNNGGEQHPLLFTLPPVMAGGGSSKALLSCTLLLKGALERQKRLDISEF